MIRCSRKGLHKENRRLARQRRSRLHHRRQFLRKRWHDPVPRLRSRRLIQTEVGLAVDRSGSEPLGAVRAVRRVVDQGGRIRAGPVPTASRKRSPWRWSCHRRRPWPPTSTSDRMEKLSFPKDDALWIAAVRANDAMHALRSAAEDLDQQAKLPRWAGGHTSVEYQPRSRRRGRNCERCNGRRVTRRISVACSEGKGKVVLIIMGTYIPPVPPHLRHYPLLHGPYTSPPSVSAGPPPVCSAARRGSAAGSRVASPGRCGGPN